MDFEVVDSEIDSEMDFEVVDSEVDLKVDLEVADSEVDSEGAGRRASSHAGTAGGRRCFATSSNRLDSSRSTVTKRARRRRFCMCGCIVKPRGAKRDISLRFSPDSANKTPMTKNKKRILSGRHSVWG